MAIPVVTTGTDVVLSYSAGTQNASLTANATNSPTSFAWTILSVPTGSTALSSTRGDFINGTATVQNPSFVTDAGIEGSYVIQCIATNGDGPSNPALDQDSAQQNVIVKTQILDLVIPNDDMYNWGKRYMSATLTNLINNVILKNGSVAFTGNVDVGAFTVDGVDISDHSARHENGGADEISVDGLSGTLADVQNAGSLRGVTVSANAPASGQFLGYNGAAWIATTSSASSTRDTKLPWITYASVSTATIAAAPGEPSQVAITLQDGIQRTFTGTLTWNIAGGVADLGLDAGTEAVSTWYYLYLVPSTGNSLILSVRGSTAVPTVGPSGYSNFRYIGALYNRDTGNLRSFIQDRSMHFHFSDPTEGDLIVFETLGTAPNLTTTGPTTDTWHDLESTTNTVSGVMTQRLLSKAAPTTVAGSVDFTASMDTDSSGAAALYIESGLDLYTPSTLALPTFARAMTQTVIDMESTSRSIVHSTAVALYNNTAVFRVSRESGSPFDFAIGVRGFSDKYL